MPITVDTGRFPLVVIHMSDPILEGDLDGLMSDLRDVIARDRRHVVVVQPEGGVHLTSTQRRWFADIDRKLAEPMRRLVIFECFVAHSALDRALLTAVGWFSTPVVPRKTFRSSAEAVAHAERVLKEHGLFPGEAAGTPSSPGG